MTSNVKFKRDSHDREICEIFLSTNATGAFLASDKIPGEDVTYAERYGAEYAAFKAADPEPRVGAGEQPHDDLTNIDNDPLAGGKPTGGIITSTILPAEDPVKTEEPVKETDQPPVGNEPAQPLGTLDSKEKAL